MFMTFKKIHLYYLSNMLKQMTLMNVVSVNRTAQYNNELNINITTYFFIIKKKKV